MMRAPQPANYKEMKRCLACDTDAMLPYLDLGEQPLANSFHTGDGSQDCFPLAVQVCPACFHSQLSVAVNPEQLYRHYLYVSGTTRTLKDYFAWFVHDVETTRPGQALSVLDIASNDGSLLAQFKQRGHSVQGVDPAENLRPLSEEKGIPTEVAYWDAQTASKLDRKFDVIVAMNVLGHIPAPFEFLQACRLALKADGLLYLQTSQADIFRNGEFDTIYHEHHSFFTQRSFRTLAERAGLLVINSRKVPIHGNSYLWTLKCPPADVLDSVHQLELEEQQSGYYDLATYRHFGRQAHETATRVRSCIEEMRRQGKAIVGYGAAAKGNTFLNFAQLPLDLVVDDNPLKEGLLTPGMNIPVYLPEKLTGVQEDLAIVILAWNFYDEILQRIRAQRPGKQDVFIRYFPGFSVCAAES
jgi:SAM-dependent methyltransferase